MNICFHAVIPTLSPIKNTVTPVNMTFSQMHVAHHWCSRIKPGGHMQTAQS